jgi:hypothetical protein
MQQHVLFCVTATQVTIVIALSTVFGPEDCATKVAAFY